MQLALEFYEGFEMAVHKYNESPGKNVYLEVFDTQRDTGITRSFTQRLDDPKRFPALDTRFNAEVQQGWLDITYLDDDLRIGRGNEGSVFVLKKV